MQLLRQPSVATISLPPRAPREATDASFDEWIEDPRTLTFAEYMAEEVRPGGVKGPDDCGTVHCPMPARPTSNFCQACFDSIRSTMPRTTKVGPPR